MGTSADIFDVFISYWSGDADRISPLVEALERCGLRVWVDKQRVEDHASITREVREGIAQSKLLVVYYSKTYPTRRACQWELMAAFTAAQGQGSPTDRILVINPERTDDGRPLSDHLYPVELRDAKFPELPNDATEASAWAGEAARIATIVRGLEGVLGVGMTEPPQQFGRRLVGDPGFVGRLGDLWQIHSALSGSNAVLVTGAAAGDVVQVAGVGGVGKSLLAEEYAVRFAAAYPGGVFWLDAGGAIGDSAAVEEAGRDAARDTQMRRIAAHLGLSAEGSSSAMVDGLIAATLANAGRCLWIVDDLPAGLSSEQARAWLAPHPNARTLITTRGRRYQFALRLDLDCLGPADGLELLVSAQQPETEEDVRAAREIVAELGGHPLALRVAAHVLKLEEGMWSFAKFHARLQDPSRDELELAEELRPELPNGHETSIATTLMRSIETLEEGGRDILRIASWMASAPIPKWFFIDSLMRADQLTADEAHNVVRSAVHATDSVSLTAAADSRRGAVLVHTLVSRTIRFREPNPMRWAVLYEAAIEEFASRLGRVDDFSTHTELSELIPHAREMAGGVDAEPSLPRTRVLAQVASFDYRRRDYELAEQEQREILARYLESPQFGERHRETIAATTHLALTLAARGALQEAFALHTRALETARVLMGEDDRETLSIINNLSLTMQAQGDLQGARKLQEQALEARRRLFGEEDKDALASAGNLAVVLSDLGESQQSCVLQEQALEVLDRMPGASSRDVMIASANLAMTLSDLGELERACEMHERTLEIAREMLGEEHPDTLVALGNFAVTLRRQGQVERARALQEQTLETYRRVAGAEHPDALTLSMNLADTLREQGHPRQARALLEQTLQARRRVLGDEHPRTLVSVEAVAQARSELGDHAGFCALQEELIEATRRVYGEKSLQSQKAIADLADALFTEGDLQRARQSYEEMLVLYRGILDGDHPEELFADIELDELDELLYRIADVTTELCSVGELQDACRLQEEVLYVCRRTLGDEHATTLHVINDLAMILDTQDEVDRASALLEELIATRRRLLGERDPATLTAIQNRKAVLASDRTFRSRDWIEAARRASLARSHVVPPRTVAKIGRNEPCPCGSGEKYKRCCEPKRDARADHSQA
jgi:tetratricopeptide (TPR) repeat protein